MPGSSSPMASVAEMLSGRKLSTNNNPSVQSPLASVVNLIVALQHNQKMNAAPTNSNINNHLTFKATIDAIMTSKEDKVKKQQPTLTQMYAVDEMKQCNKHRVLYGTKFQIPQTDELISSVV